MDEIGDIVDDDECGWMDEREMWKDGRKWE